MKFLHRMIVLCLIAILAAAASPLLANSSQPANVAQAQEGGVSLYIPLVMKYHTSELPPFTIQIAGLSQITTSSAFARLSTAEAAETQAQLVAELDEAFPTMLEALKDSGAGYVRVYIDWASIQPDKDSYAWSFYDKRLPQLHQAGLGLIATVTNAPLWAKVNQDPCGIISDTQAYYAFLTALEQQYPYIEVWEILNEPDANVDYRCGNGVMNYGAAGQQYADLLRGAYDLLKGLNPATTVIMGGMAYDGFADEGVVSHFNRYFLDDMIKNGGASAMDGVNFHYFKNYAGGWEGWTHDGKPTCLGAINVADPGDTFYSPYGFDVIAKASHISERLSTCYGVSSSLWLTETGANGVGPQNPDFVKTSEEGNPLYGATLADQARYVFTVHARGFASGVENITWYALKIIPELTTEDHQGLLFDARDGALDNSPKPSFDAYKTLTGELGYYRYSNWVAFDPRTQPQAEVYQFKHLAGQNAGKDKLVAWSNSSNPVPLTLSNTQIRVVSCPVNGGAAAEVTVTDGGAGDADGAANGSIRLNLTIDPVIIELVK